MPTLWLALALLAADDGGGPRFEGSVAAAGGYDAGLLVASDGASLGSPVGSLSATGGASIDVSDSVFLYLGATLDGVRFSALPDLDRAAAGAEATLLVDLVGPLALVLSPSASWAWFADPARSGASLVGRATLRYRPMRWLTLRTGYAHVLRTAADPVYDMNLDRVFASVEFRLAKETWITLGALGERGTGTYYQEVPGTAGDPAAITAYVPYQSAFSTVGASLGFEQGLWGGLSLHVAASFRRTTAPDGVYDAPSASAAVAWRWF